MITNLVIEYWLSIYWTIHKSIMIQVVINQFISYWLMGFWTTYQLVIYLSIH